MTPKKCMSIAKSLTDTQHMELEPLCSGLMTDLGHIKLFSTELFCKKKSIFYTISCKIPFKKFSNYYFFIFLFYFLT